VLNRPENQQFGRHDVTAKLLSHVESVFSPLPRPIFDNR